MTKKLNPMPKNLMFALDIGTRSVVGVLSKKVDKKYVVVDYEIMEHPDRAMFDGQIHDIAKVTEVVKTVVGKIEERNGFRLEQAAIAAAGRALKTERAVYELEIDVTKEIDKSVTDSIEMQAIQLAQKKLTESNELQSSYYCVGYSVINYFLDNSMILNPVGHRGQKLSVDIIATFLPHIVVDSLYSVINKAGLEVMNLTLEPIASINVAIPQNLRLLNLALVDVGAGTSDIAISKDGSVISYGMVALAGDEITEKIAQTYLLDFNNAEKLKIGLCKNGQNKFVDVLGLTHEMTTDEIMMQLEDVVDNITKEVAENIIQLNKKGPSAVFCIGGGAQIPGFTSALAKHLNLPLERVVIKSVENLEMISFETTALVGPEFITPMGIGVTAFEERDQDFIQVNVNETAIRLFNSKPLQVSDALILTGYNARSLISERGESYTITIDDTIREIKGDYGEPARIYINGVQAHLDSKINHKDQITIISAEKGKPRRMTLREAVKLDSFVSLNGEKIKTIEFVSVNGVNRTGEYILIAGDEIVTKGIKTVRELAEAVELDLTQFAIYLGEQKLEPSYKIRTGDAYTYIKEEESIVVSEDKFKKDSDSNSGTESSEGFEGVNSVSAQNDVKASGHLDVVINGSAVQIPNQKKEIVFVDIFNHIEFDLTKPQGILVLKLNGERAKYTDLLKSGDIIDVFWNN